MIIEVNGDPVEVPPGADVGMLVMRVVPSAKGVAVALNGDIVPRSAWGAQALSEGDSVEVLGAAQGG